LTAITVALTTTAPVGSVTVPFTLAVIVCASRAPEENNKIEQASRTVLISFFIVFDLGEIAFKGQVVSLHLQQPSGQRAQADDLIRNDCM